MVDLSHCRSMTNFIEQIRRLIDSRGMTITAAADAIGIDRANLSRILSGKEGVTVERAEKIANAFGATVCVKDLKDSKKLRC